MAGQRGLANQTNLLLKKLRPKQGFTDQLLNLRFGNCIDSHSSLKLSKQKS
jgi:hypothetical protein